MYNTISWQEVKILIQGLLPETPLGQVVSIRSENDPKMLKAFSKSQKQIRSEWRAKLARDKAADEKTLEQSFADLELMLKNAFG